MSISEYGTQKSRATWPANIKTLIASKAKISVTEVGVISDSAPKSVAGLNFIAFKLPESTTIYSIFTVQAVEAGAVATEKDGNVSVNIDGMYLDKAKEGYSFKLLAAEKPSTAKPPTGKKQ